MDSKDVHLWRTLFGSIAIASFLAIFDLINLAADKGFSLFQPKWLILSIIIAATGIFAVALFIFTWTKPFNKLKKSYENRLPKFSKFRKSILVRWLFSAFFFATLFLLPIFISQPYLVSLFGDRLWIKILIFLLNTFLGASFLRVARKDFKKDNENVTWIENLLFSALLQLLVYQLFLASLYITDYPFAIGWTRDSRYYYASLFFAERLYGMKLPLPILHPTLHFIFSFPYLFGKMPIWVHRGWSVLLTLGLSWGVSVALISRPDSFWKPVRSPYSILFTIWAYLFLTTGSIYAHLLVPSLIIFLFVSPQNLRRSWVAIIIASAWAGMSRINWFPVPAMLAALIYFLDMETRKVFKDAEIKPFGSKIIRYFAFPAAWFFTGIASAFAAQALYIQLSGNGARDAFFTSLASDLLWYRLLPNATYPPGILWGAVFLSLPLIILVFYASKKWDILQKLGIFSILFVLFVGGLVVSVKIGGGADLHNMDAYFVSLLLVGTTSIVHEFRLGTPHQYLRGILLFSASLVLAWFILHGAGARGYDVDVAQSQLDAFQAQIMRADEAGNEILFISQRHLLATQKVEGIPLIPEYEKDVLMEMVMSRNRPYLDGFYDDLRHQKFGLIVIDPQTDSLLGEKRSFAVENNRWILKVTRPLWCYYEPLALYGGVELYVPRAEVKDCK